MKATEIKSNGYSVYVGADFYELTNRYFSEIQSDYTNYVVLVDENSSKYCLTPLLLQIDFLKDALFIEIESGEENKRIATCERIWEQLAKLKADRKTLFINLGGGVISDLGGFAASVYKRGIDYVNFPTTLLAQVDASVGGKVGIDLGALKNAVGLFSKPKAVFVYPPYLNTLSARQLISGYAEMLKHALINDLSLWNKLKKMHPTKGLNAEVIAESIKIKNAVVMQDFEEKGVRKTLNFGHTIGHAIESYSLLNDRKPLLHGEAMAIGICCESYLSMKRCGLDQKQFNDIKRSLLDIFPAYKIKLKSYATLLDFMRNDKKNQGKSIGFALLSEIGKCEINCFCDEELIVESLEFYRKSLE